MDPECQTFFRLMLRVDDDGVTMYCLWVTKGVHDFVGVWRHEQRVLAQWTTILGVTEMSNRSTEMGNRSQQTSTPPHSSVPSCMAHPHSLTLDIPSTQLCSADEAIESARSRYRNMRWAPLLSPNMSKLVRL